MGADELDIDPLSWDGHTVTTFGSGPVLAN